MSPSICSHKKAHFPKVGSGRDPPYLRGEGAKYIYVHIHICMRGQRPAPHRRAQSPAQTLCLEDGAEAMKGEEWIQVFHSFPERSCFEGREKQRDTAGEGGSVLPVRLDYSRSPPWIACCSLAVALQRQALPLPLLAEMTVTAGAISPLGDALEEPPSTSLQGAGKPERGEKQPPRPGSLP